MMDMEATAGRTMLLLLFWCNVGALYGGAETELALEQEGRNDYTRRRLQYSTSTGKKRDCPISDAQINAAYDRVRAGNGAGADFALLKDAGWTASELSALTGGGPDGPDGNAIDAAIDRLYGGTGTQDDIQTLIDAEYDIKDLKCVPGYVGERRGRGHRLARRIREASLPQYKIQRRMTSRSA